MATANERINIRTSQHTKELIEQASALMGVSVSNFIIQQAYDKAVEVLKNEQNLYFDKVEIATLQALLDNPPMANEKLKGLLALGNSLDKV